ncbi:MAG: amidohydrolase, partial [Pseudomonadota bacterium]
MRLLAVLSILAVTNTLTRTALADEADNGWNVSEPAFSVAAGEARLDIDRGTWISLDVSPDGRTIAFDLLGDIYTLPIDGGTATNISAGLHWDMQPRFSPDGSRIAFTSDRAGGDNVWIMAADGGNAAALTSETFRLLNNPAWSPDGRYIAARKHFTTQRSLGTGEIWLYDIRGGDGVAVVERPGKGFQKELGEPVFTADGSGIYYTQNVTPGDSFVYGQDSNKEVFRIRRITLATGDVDDIAGGPGGAVRAAPSPDGRWLAYVKRVRAKSRLFVKDLESGAERMLVDELDQDMQETWGVHGLYPNMDWLPDSSAIVFWRNGHIERVAIADGSVERIPFRVEDTRRTYPAPRFKVDVAPDEFDTRMVRWAQRADAGERVYYESLGRLYVRDGDAPPRRLTRDDDDGFETYPALSRDGRWVYFVRWNDEALGSLRRVRAGGGRSEALGGAPGHYRELAVSPDGTMLAYRLADGHRLLAPGGAAENGIYVRPVRGGEAAQISETGREPHFGGAGDRVYFVTRKPGNRAGTDNVRLLSANLGGHDERVHATSDFATSLRVAPDDRHVAFIENYQVFVAPLPPLDKPVELGPKASSLPVRRISASGGEYAGWAGAGTVFWSLGPTFKQASLAGIYGDGFEAPATGRSLSLRAAGDRPAGRVALTDARIVTMRGDEVLDNATILIDGNRIEAVG